MLHYGVVGTRSDYKAGPHQPLEPPHDGFVLFPCLGDIVAGLAVGECDGIGDLGQGWPCLDWISLRFEERRLGIGRAPQFN